MNIEVNGHTAAPQREVFADKDTLTGTVASKLLQVLRGTIEADGIAHVSLTGGGAGIGTLSAVAEMLREKAETQLDWSAVHFWWGDERLLPARDGERNDQQARNALLDFLVAEHDLPQENIHSAPTSEDAANPSAAAQIYAQQLQAFSASEGVVVPGSQKVLRLPVFAVMLLGVGPDGHINSLFPGKSSLAVSEVTTVGEEDSPKPPPQRVSLTFDAIHTAQRVWTVVAGEDKAEAVRLAFEPRTPTADIPAKNARGASETIWHIDQPAAVGLA